MYLLFHDFRNIIDYAFKNNYHFIIDKLLIYDNSLFSQVKETLGIYNESIRYPISAKKLFKLLNTN